MTDVLVPETLEKAAEYLAKRKVAAKLVGGFHKQADMTQQAVVDALKPVLIGAGIGGVGGYAAGNLSKRKLDPMSTAMSGAIAGAGLGAGYSAYNAMSSNQVPQVPDAHDLSMTRQQFVNQRLGDTWGRFLGNMPVVGDAVKSTLGNDSAKPVSTPAPAVKSRLESMPTTSEIGGELVSDAYNVGTSLPGIGGLAGSMYGLRSATAQNAAQKLNHLSALVNPIKGEAKAELAPVSESVAKFMKAMDRERGSGKVLFPGTRLGHAYSRGFRKLDPAAQKELTTLLGNHELQPGSVSPMRSGLKWGLASAAAAHLINQLLRGQ